jgi:hypothetical protein
MGEEAPKIKRPAGLGIFQPVTDCKDDSDSRLEDETKRDRPTQPANEILPEIAVREQPFHGLQPPQFSGIVNPLGGLGRYKGFAVVVGRELLFAPCRFGKRTNSFISIKSHQKSLS